MCLLLVSFQPDSEYPWVVASNRDEFLNRPTLAAHFWSDHPQILGGRDAKENGTWLAVTKSGKFAALTNYRDPTRHAGGKKSRGWVVNDCLLARDPTERFLAKLMMRADEYNDFNLMVGTSRELFFYSNPHRSAQNLPPGVYGVSNQDLDSPWPKLNEAKYRFEKALTEPDDQTAERIFEILTNASRYEDSLLPDTGIGLEWERRLSSIFIPGPDYGTRSSTVISMAKSGRIRFEERTYEGDSSKFQAIRHEFDIGRT
jgi:uncharacterized protein with NRDE domain